MGVHRTQRGALSVTGKCADGHCYPYNVMTRRGDPLPTNRFGELTFRCRHRGCKAKMALIPSDIHKLKDYELNFDQINRSEFWSHSEHKDGIHTCPESNRVPPWYSDQQILSDMYREYKTKFHDHGGNVAWRVACQNMETGLGMNFDAIITKTRVQHANSVKYDRKKRQAPSNQNILSSSDLQVEEDMQYLTYTVKDRYGRISGENQKWYQGTDSRGNHYFMSRKDAQILAREQEVHIDSTFDPIAGIKEYFRQLLCICVRTTKPDGTIVIHVAW